jgi:hypothetical protein
MAHESHSKPDRSIASLVSGLIADAKALLQQELTLAKLEIGEELRIFKAALLSLSIGIGIAAVGGLLLAFMLVYLVATYTPIPLWGCYGMVGGVFVIVGGVLLYCGVHTISALEVVPPKTAETLKEDVAWMKEQIMSNGRSHQPSRPRRSV